ncbi:hypothetical protein ACP70R_010324 [Stipagrostis hirtigluma subsp. patula]
MASTTSLAASPQCLLRPPPPSSASEPPPRHRFPSPPSGSPFAHHPGIAAAAARPRAMMGVEGSVVDAAIGWVVQTILGSLLTDKRRPWRVRGGARSGAGEGARRRERAAGAELLHDAEDVLDELNYLTPPARDPEREVKELAYKGELASRLRILKMERCAELKDFTLFQSYSWFKVEQKAWFPFLKKLTAMDKSYNQGEARLRVGVG